MSAQQHHMATGVAVTRVSLFKTVIFLASTHSGRYAIYLYYRLVQPVTSRMYIGLAVRLYVFHLFSLVSKLLYLCRERPDQESDRTDSLVSSLSV